MTKCSDACTPCCDFCVFAIHEVYDDDQLGKITGGPKSCSIHPEPEYDLICESGGACDDFTCTRSKVDKK